MSLELLKNLIQVLIHEQNNELSKIIMHLENSLEDQSFEEVKSALNAFDPYMDLTQMYSRFIKRSFATSKTVIQSNEDIEMLKTVLEVLASKKKKQLQIEIELHKDSVLSYQEVVECVWILINTRPEESVQVRFETTNSSQVWVNSSVFDLEAIRKNSI